jgi:hypothetical protein
LQLQKLISSWCKLSLAATKINKTLVDYMGTSPNRGNQKAQRGPKDQGGKNQGKSIQFQLLLLHCKK